MVKNGLKCLRNASSIVTGIYTQALLAYVYSLAGDGARRDSLLAKLDQQAIKSGIVGLSAALLRTLGLP